MNHIIRQLVALRREQAAADATTRWAPYTEQPVSGANVLRFGVARIVSNDGDGQYKITEQWWNPNASPPAWEDAKKPVGYVEAAARDYGNCTLGVDGLRVLFWEQRAKGGSLELLIDAAGRGLCWGKATADWTGGNAVTLDPCQADGTDIANAGNVTAYIISPTGGTPDGDGLEPDISQNDVLAYLPYGGDKGVLVNVRWKITGADVLGIQLVADKQYHITGNSTVTVHDANWRGRTIWYSMQRTNAESEAAADSLQQWDNHTSSVGVFMTGADPWGDNEIVIDTYTDPVGGETVTFYIDDLAAGGGKLKLRTENFDPPLDGMNLRVTAIGFKMYDRNNNQEIT